MIILKSEAEIEAIKVSSKFAAEVLVMIEPFVKPGITTLELNDICHNYIIKHGAIPAPLNYKGFPKSICTSINEVVCHGIPSHKHFLKDGDIINVDVTTIIDGFHGDTSKTFFVGTKQTNAMVRVTECAKKSLRLGIDAVRVGARVGDIGATIQSFAEGQGFSVVRDFVGHGIGRSFHEDPQVPHYGQPGKGPRLEAGMVFTIEPMINVGDWRTKILSDGWTAVTLDRLPSAQFEHTIAIHHDGRVEVLTEI